VWYCLGGEQPSTGHWSAWLNGSLSEIRQAVVGAEVGGHACKPFSHTSNSTLQCGSPGPPDVLQSNKVYDDTAVTRYTDRHLCNLNALQCST